MDSDTRKFYEMKAEILQAVGHPIRLAIIEFLNQREQCVCDIIEHVGARRSNVSRHLSVMLRAGILECRKEGLKMIYTLHTHCVVDFLACVDQALQERMESEVALLKRLQSNSA
ncbi:MAG: metalloregulator ArsR/SmtB family transcription factor [Planctomycetota bacterium]|nr:metalloregulator ArsR/SmtB family transcription factor [Planctomycetota bacterium]